MTTPVDNGKCRFIDQVRKYERTDRWHQMKVMISLISSTYCLSSKLFMQLHLFLMCQMGGPLFRM